MRGTRSTRWLPILACVLALAACRKHEPKGEAASTERPAPTPSVELHVIAPGMAAEEVEALVVQPLEGQLFALPQLAHLTAEATDGRARFVLELVPGGDVASARASVAERVAKLRTSLPPGVDAPVLVPSAAPEHMRVRWYVHSQALDPLSMSKLHASLVARSEAIAGVRAVETCAPQRRLVIELDATRLRAYGLDTLQVEGALSDALVDVPGFGTTRESITSLRTLVIGTASEQALTLGELAAIRYGFGDPDCIAATAGGIAASATVSVEGPAALTAVRSMLDDATRELPPDVRLGRFGPEDTVLALSLPSGTELQQGAELIGGGFGADTSWLVEVGVEAEPCVGSGLRVHLSVPGPAADNRALAESLDTIPGILDVELLGRATPPRRLWLLGPDLELLARLARDLSRELEGLRAYIDDPLPELAVEPDREALARYGISAADLGRQLALARGVELTTLREAEGAPIPVVLRTTGSDVDELDALRELTIAGGEQAVPLTAVAALQQRRAPTRICRRDGRRGILLTISAGAAASTSLERDIEARLPPGHSWAWADDRG